MDLFECMRQRRSTRAFHDRPVPEELLQRVLEAARSAPSAGNLQAYHIYVVRDRRVREQLAAASLDQSFIAEAPVALVFCSDPPQSAPRYGRRGEELYALQDATIACAFAHLAATALGLGSVWVGAFQDEAVARAIGAPPHHRPIAILPVGYPAEEPPARPRRPLHELVTEV